MTQDLFSSPHLPLQTFQNLMAYLCHELISPLSAIVTGIDLLGSDGDMMEDLLPVLQTASNRIRTRVEYYRSAFGPGGVSLSMAQTQKHITQMWPPSSGPEPAVFLETVETTLPPQIGQKILLMALWGSLQGGTCVISYTKETLALCLNGHPFAGESLEKMLAQKASEGDCHTPPQALLTLLGCPASL